MKPNGDFADDGGTPAWRRRRVRPRVPFLHLCLGMIVAGFVLPWAVIIGGVLALGVWHALFD